MIQIFVHHKRVIEVVVACVHVLYVKSKNGDKFYPLALVDINEAFVLYDDQIHGIDENSTAIVINYVSNNFERALSFVTLDELYKQLDIYNLTSITVDMFNT
jgi:hypothetical protein